MTIGILVTVKNVGNVAVNCLIAVYKLKALNFLVIERVLKF